MNRERRTHDEKVADEADVVAPLPQGPVDADWPEQERKSPGYRKPDDPDAVHDESPLESLGEAVSDPLREGASTQRKEHQR